MMTRTWPYGTTKTVTVLETAPGNPCILLCKDQDREGYVLIGGAGDENAAKAGDVGTIVFTKGGPFGGYWLYKANAGGEGRAASARTSPPPCSAVQPLEEK